MWLCLLALGLVSLFAPAQSGYASGPRSWWRVDRGVAYVLFAVSGPVIVILLGAFALAGVGIGCAETAEHAAVAAFAPEEVRGSAFGLLATVQRSAARTSGGSVARR